MSVETPADYFMVTAQALGLTPRQRREGLDRMAEAAARLDDEGGGSDGCSR